MKVITAYLLLFIAISTQAQLKNFGTHSKFKIKPTFKYGIYAYYDVVRERGIGFQLQKGVKWNFDLSVYNIYDNTKMFGGVQYNYTDFRGLGASFKSKLFIDKVGRFYVGPNVGFENVKHDLIWVNRSYETGDNSSFTYQTAKGYILNVGGTLGLKIQIKNGFIEPFGAVGLGINLTTSTVYCSNYTKNIPINYIKPPYDVRFRHQYLHFNLGVKLGFSFKNYLQQREIINKNFDSLYIPRLQKLKKSFNEIGADSIKRYSDLNIAYKSLDKLNSYFLIAYKKNYNKLEKFYDVVNNHINFIDNKLVEHFIFKEKYNSLYIPEMFKLKKTLDSLDTCKLKHHRYINYAQIKWRNLNKRLIQYPQNNTRNKISLNEYNIHKNEIERLIYLAN